MDSTEKALENIRAEWLAQGSTPATTVAKRANMPAITVRRYLDGSTKHGDPAKVRALAIALGRMDIAETVKDSIPVDQSDAIAKFMAEKFLLWRESNLEELEIERKAREDSEKRLTAELERMTTSKDKSIDMLTRRIAQLEKDKENQALVNKELSADKATINTEMHVVRNTKRKHDILLILSLILNVGLACGLAYCLYLL